MARGTCAGTGLAGRGGVPLWICRRPALLGLVGCKGALIPELEKADVRELKEETVHFPPICALERELQRPSEVPQGEFTRYVVCCLHPLCCHLEMKLSHCCALLEMTGLEFPK